MNYLRSLNADEKIIEFWEGGNPQFSHEFLIGRQKGQTIQERLRPPKWRRHALGTASTFSKAPLSSARKQRRT